MRSVVFARFGFRPEIAIEERLPSCCVESFGDVAFQKGVAAPYDQSECPRLPHPPLDRVAATLGAILGVNSPEYVGRCLNQRLLPLVAAMAGEQHGDMLTRAVR